MVLHHGSAVGHAVKKRLTPIPGRMKADRPPERPSTPQAKAENHGGQTSGKQSDWGLSWVLAVAQAEEEGKNYGRGPEAQGLGARKQ